MSLYNHAAYLQQILNNPKTSTQEYLRVERELQAIRAHQNYINQLHKNSDKLTGGQDV